MFILSFDEVYAPEIPVYSYSDFNLSRLVMRLSCFAVIATIVGAPDTDVERARAVNATAAPIVVASTSNTFSPRGFDHRYMGENIARFIR